ncbi:NB-ARC domain-containing protein [Nostoc sp.]|uniref:NB-ARC domain-containing protein n=1 Tax=Nostoc sp. TaxID=1180 RepID=UPI002FF8E430
MSGESIPELKKKTNLTLHHLFLGKLTNVPELPPHFLPRPEELAALKHKVLSPTKQPVRITGKSRRVGVQGMGGIGKTILATALARDEEVRKAFPDGVFWVAFGQTPQILTWQSYLASALGDKQAAFTEIRLAKARLRELFANKASLLILDDIWRLDDATAFDVLGEHCQMLVTTRDAAIVTGLGGEEYQLAVLDAQQALKILADWANKPEIMYSTEQNDVALQVAQECGYLPLALVMVGAMMRGKPPNRWHNILEKLCNADLEKIKQQFPDYPYPNLLKAIQVSVEDMSENYQQRYLDFAVFPENIPIPEAVLQTFWKPLGLDEFDTQDVIDELVNKSLALRDEVGNLRLHDLQFDYVKKQHATLVTKSEGIEFLHNRLLNAYSKKYPAGWDSLENDGYILQNLAYNLLAGRRETELQQLLCDFRWLQAKLENTNINALIADYDFLPECENLQLIQGALRLSAHILAEDKTQLTEQLWGRLQCFSMPDIQALLKTAKQSKTVWLQPLSSSLIKPNEQMQRTLISHTALVTALAITPDGERVISGSSDKTIKVWNLKSGQLLFTLEGHTAPVTALAITPDSERVISSSFDKTLKIWEIKSRKELFTCIGHKKRVTAVAITPDGKWVISGSIDKTLKIWDLETGQELFTLRNNSMPVRTLAITPDGKRLISVSQVSIFSFSDPNSFINIWDLEKKEIILTVKPDVGVVRSLAVTPDGKQFISGSCGGNIDDACKIFVWDLETGEKFFTIGTNSLPMVDVLAVTADGQRLISSNLNGATISVWNLKTGEELNYLIGHDNRVISIAVTPNGQQLISAAADCTLKIWDLATVQKTNDLRVEYPKFDSGAKNPQQHLDSYIKQFRPMLFLNLLKATIVFSHDGKKVIYNSGEDNLKILDVEKIEAIQTFRNQGQILNGLTVTLDSKKIIYNLGLNYNLKVLDLNTWEEINSFVDDNDVTPMFLTLTSEGNELITVSIFRTIKKWDLKTGTLNKSVNLLSPQFILTFIKFLVFILGKIYFIIPILFLNIPLLLPNESNVLLNFVIIFILLNIFPYFMRIFSFLQESISIEYLLLLIFNFIQITITKKIVLDVAVTPDKKQIILGLANKTIEIWDLEKFEKFFTLTGHSDKITAVIVNYNHKQVISGSADKTIKVWNLENGMEVFTLKGHKNDITSLALSNDGKYLFSASSDNIFKVWDLDNQIVITSFYTDNELRACAVAPDGITIVAGESSGQLHFFRLEGV